MLRSIWILVLGITMSLMACGVEPTQEGASEGAASEEGAIIDTSNRVSAATDEEQAGAEMAHFTGEELSSTPMATCTSPAWQLCCPYPQGCSCPGIQDCQPDGTWGQCMGMGQAGQPCP